MHAALVSAAHRHGKDRAQNFVQSFGHKTIFHGKHPCPKCSFVSVDENVLADHILSLHSDSQHCASKCHLCDASFLSGECIPKHVKYHSDSLGVPKFNCIICGRGYRQASQYIGHMNNHAKQRPYRCAKCSRGYPYKTTADHHERSLQCLRSELGTCSLKRYKHSNDE